MGLKTLDNGNVRITETPWPLFETWVPFSGLLVVSCVARVLCLPGGGKGGLENIVLIVVIVSFFVILIIVRRMAKQSTIKAPGYIIVILFDAARTVFLIEMDEACISRSRRMC